MTPEMPYYAVVFTSRRTSLEAEPYAEMAAEMMELARKQPGFLGVDHARETIGITVSYWDSLKSIADWKSHSRHVLAQEKGRECWYESYNIRICRVEREYSFDRKWQESERTTDGNT
jgi:heme-degrading monooxygenase HmoA